MTSKAIARIMLRVDKALVRAVQAALSEIEKEARKALKVSPDTFKSFRMIGGNAAFHVVSQECGDEHLTPGDVARRGHDNPHAFVIAKLLDEYDGMFKLTRYPMLLKRDNAGQIIMLKDW